MAAYDMIVAGLGGIGSAAASHLARRGLRVLGLDRFPPAHDRGSSHGRTRMIRQAYFEHPDYVPLVLRAYQLWSELEARRRTKLYHEVGLLQIGAADGVVVPGVLQSARQHGLDVESLSVAQIRDRFPGFRVEEPLAGVFEARAGYLTVEACVQAHLDDAAEAGAELRTGEAIRGWNVTNDSVRVETDQGSYSAGRLVVAAGAWASQLLAEVGLPLVVRRKPQYWYLPTSDDYSARHGCPAFLFERGEAIFYGFPQIGPEGVKVAEHTGGSVVTDPLALTRDVDRADQGRVEDFLRQCMPGVSMQLTGHAACMYTLTPDQDFVLDRHPKHAQVVFVAGLSGHGFKFAPVLGQALAELAVDGTTNLPIGFLAAARAALAR